MNKKQNSPKNRDGNGASAQQAKTQAEIDRVRSIYTRILRDGCKLLLEDAKQKKPCDDDLYVMGMVGVMVAHDMRIAIDAEIAKINTSEIGGVDNE